MVEIYCDECRQDILKNKEIISNNNCYTILGGIWIDKSNREELKNDIKKLKNKYKVYGEIKWKKVSNLKLQFYKDLIDLFFNCNAEFRAIVIDAKTFDINYHNNSSELGFYKCYYQLLKEWIDKDKEYNILLDFRKDKSKNRAYDLKKCINNYMKKTTIKNIQFINSKESLLLQLEDVLMGAVGYKYNLGKSKAKLEIIKTIEKYYPIKQTTSKQRKFNIFKIKLEGGNNE